MRAVVFDSVGGPDVMRVDDVPAPVAAAGEVVLDVAATAVNRADLLQRQGFYPPPAGASPILGLECSGTVADVGEGVDGWRVGDEACALLVGGGYAQQVSVPAGQLLPIPAGMSLVDAAALPEVSCTVWSKVFDIGALRAGETLLVHGGTGGVGTFAIQFAQAAGARVLTTVGSARKAVVALSLGADVAINYRDEDFVDAVRVATEGRGVDVILDNMGAKYLPRNVSALAVGGRLVVLGLQGGVKGELNLATLLTKRASIHAASLRSRSLDDKHRIVSATEAAFWPLLASGAVHPVIHEVLSLDDVVHAHRLVESSEHIGKVVLRVR